MCEKLEIHMVPGNGHGTKHCIGVSAMGGCNRIYVTDFHARLGNSVPLGRQTKPVRGLPNSVYSAPAKWYSHVPNVDVCAN